MKKLLLSSIAAMPLLALASSPLTSEPVEVRPAGASEIIERSSVGLEVFYGLMDQYPEPGLVVEKVQGEDGKVWFNNPLSRYPLDSWIYGTLEGDVLTIPGGQCVGWGWTDDDDMVKAYIAAVRYQDDDLGGWCRACDDPDFRLKVKGDVLVAEDADLCLGLCSYDENSGKYRWLSYADRYVTYAPNTGVLVEAPKGMETERWALTTPDGTGYLVNVATSPDAVYVQGIYNVLPESWVKLDIEGDKAVMYPGQYLGIGNDRHYAYACAGIVEEWYDPEWDEYFDKVFPTESLTFSYDASARVLEAADGAVIIATSEQPAKVDSYVERPRIEYQTRIPGTPPAAPTNLGYMAYDEYWGSGMFWFDIPCVDVDGNLLDSSHLYWRLWVDEEVYEFVRDDDYWNLPEEEMTMIPWGMNLYGNFYAMGISHSMTFYFDGFDSLGVQSVYLDPDLDGEMLKSTVIIGVVNGEVSADSIEAADSEAPVYNLQGIRVSNPGHGIYIRDGKKIRL